MWLARGHGIHSGARDVLKFLIAADNEDTKAVWPSQQTIATETKLGLRTVERAIAMWQAVGAIGIMYTTRSAALAAGIPVHRHGNRTMNVYRVYYDWDGFHRKPTKAEVETINAAMEDRVSFLPTAWYEVAPDSHKAPVKPARVAASNPPGWRPQTRQGGGLKPARVAGERLFLMKKAK